MLECGMVGAGAGERKRLRYRVFFVDLELEGGGFALKPFFNFVCFFPWCFCETARFFPG